MRGKRKRIIIPNGGLMVIYYYHGRFVKHHQQDMWPHFTGRKPTEKTPPSSHHKLRHSDPKHPPMRSKKNGMKRMAIRYGKMMGEFSKFSRWENLEIGEIFGKMKWWCKQLCPVSFLCQCHKNLTITFQSWYCKMLAPNKWEKGGEKFFVIVFVVPQAIPRHSMYGLFTYIWVVCGVNVGN